MLRLRLDNKLPAKHIAQLKQAMEERDFHTFCEVTMRESNQLHAICLDTIPAIFYMNQTSKNLVNMVRDINASQDDKHNIVAYSIDAGFHVFLFCMQENVQMVKDKIEATPIITRNLENIIETSIDAHGIEPL